MIGFELNNWLVIAFPLSLMGNLTAGLSGQSDEEGSGRRVSVVSQTERGTDGVAARAP